MAEDGHACGHSIPLGSETHYLFIKYMQSVINQKFVGTRVW